MKKISVIIAALIVGTSFALAESYSGVITWMATAGVYNHASTSDSFDDVATDGILAQYDVMWQLIHTFDGETHAANASTWNSDYLQEGKEELIDSRSGNASYYSSTFDMDESLFKVTDGLEPISSPLTVDSTQAYYVYQRVYELPAGEAPKAGSYYWDSGVENVTPQFDGLVNNAKVFVEYDGQTTWETPIKPNQIVQGVPEPATMSLLGLGALAMVLRRKLRK